MSTIKYKQLDHSLENIAKMWRELWEAEERAIAIKKTMSVEEWEVYTKERGYHSDICEILHFIEGSTIRSKP